MARKGTWKRIRSHRNYTPDEAARALGVCVQSVRRWIKLGLLPAMTEQKPALILGVDLIAFLQSRNGKRARCALGECYCFGCRKPRRPAFGEAEIVATAQGKPNMRALCETCGALMHKRVSAARLTEISVILTIQDRRQTDT
jgi:hypothetical protein